MRVTGVGKQGASADESKLKYAYVRIVYEYAYEYVDKSTNMYLSVDSGRGVWDARTHVQRQRSRCWEAEGGGGGGGGGGGKDRG